MLSLKAPHAAQRAGLAAQRTALRPRVALLPGLISTRQVRRDLFPCNPALPGRARPPRPASRALGLRALYF